MSTQYSVDLVFKSKGMGALDKMNRQMQSAKGHTDKAKNSIVSFDRASKAAAGSAKGAAVATKGLGAAIGAALGPIVGIAAAIGVAGKALNVFKERQADAAALGNGLKNLGIEGTQVLQALTKKADEFGKKTLFSQEDYSKAATQLTSFTNIAVKEYDRVINIAGDVAQVMGQDVKSATTQLAKALNDPAQNLSALSRSGIQFTEQQKEQINAMQAAGNIAGAQSLILKELERQYQGAAEAAGGAGLAGALDSIGETANDMLEKMGALFDTLAGPVLEVFAHQLERVNEWWAYLGQEILPLVSEALAPVWEQLEALAHDLNFDGIQDFVQNVLITGMKAAIGVLTNVGKLVAGFIQKMRELADNPAMKFLIQGFQIVADKLGLSTNHMEEFRDKQAAAAETAEKVLEAQEGVAKATMTAAEASRALKDAQVEVAAATKSQAEQQKHSVSLSQLETKLASLVLDGKQAQLEAQLKLAKNDTQRKGLQKQLKSLALERAKQEHKAAKAAIEAGLKEKEIALEAARAYESKVKAVVELAKAQGVANEHHEAALTAAKEATQQAQTQLQYATELADVQVQIADQQYKNAVNAEKYASQLERAATASKSIASSGNAFSDGWGGGRVGRDDLLKQRADKFIEVTGQLSTAGLSFIDTVTALSNHATFASAGLTQLERNLPIEQSRFLEAAMGDVAITATEAGIAFSGSRYDVERAQEAMQNLRNSMNEAADSIINSARSIGIGLGTRTSGSLTLQGSSEAIQKALQHSRIGTLGEDGRYHIDWNRLAQLRQVGSGPLSAPGALDELRESIKHWEEVLRQNAERAAARSQVEADRLARFQAHQSQAGQVRVSVQTSGASVVRLNDDDYLRKDAAADMASRAATEARRSVLNDLSRSSSTRLSVGLR